MKQCDALVDIRRRAFFARTAALASGATAALAVPARAAPSPAMLAYPTQRLANIADLKLNEPLAISYPDPASPGVLLKLGAPVADGAGPDGDIVAFSTMCPHKGFPLNYNQADRSFSCPGHYSRFDAEQGGLEIWGQATQNLPQFRLAVDAAGDIHAVAVDELIYGRLSNILQA